MVAKKILGIFQSGGEFETGSDGLLSYKGGCAHAMEIDGGNITYKRFEKKVAKMFNFKTGKLYFRYLLPSNRKNLITISSDEDLKSMVSFHGDSNTADIYVMTEQVVHMMKEKIQRSYNHAYNQLLSLCEHTMKKDPGTFAAFTINEDSTLRCLFISFHASLYGFQHGCRPLLFLYSTLIRSKCRGTLLTATAADGNAEHFPVALAIVDTESDENWRWFLLQLKNALSLSCRGMTTSVGDAESIPPNSPSTRRCITIISKREKGLKESLAEIFPNGEVYHAYCISYLFEELIRELKVQFSDEVIHRLRCQLASAARAMMLDDFHGQLDNIKNISAEAYDWIMQKSEIAHWANVYLPLSPARYQHLVSNLGQHYYDDWVSDADDLPIHEMLRKIRARFAGLISSRSTEFNQWRKKLTPSFQNMFEYICKEAHSLKVVLSYGSKFVVSGGNSVENVDMDKNDCSCKIGHFTGLPCCHVIAVAYYLICDPYDYCSIYYTSYKYRLTYSQSIHSLYNEPCHVERRIPGNAVIISLPPAGRAKNELQESSKSQRKCSRCKATGHNKSTCKEFLFES